MKTGNGSQPPLSQTEVAESAYYLQRLIPGYKIQISLYRCFIRQAGNTVRIPQERIIPIRGFAVIHARRMLSGIFRVPGQILPHPFSADFFKSLPETGIEQHPDFFPQSVSGNQDSALVFQLKGIHISAILPAQCFAGFQHEFRRIAFRERILKGQAGPFVNCRKPFPDESAARLPVGIFISRVPFPKVIDRTIGDHCVNIIPDGRAIGISFLFDTGSANFIQGREKISVVSAGADNGGQCSAPGGPCNHNPFRITGRKKIAVVTQIADHSFRIGYRSRGVADILSLRCRPVSPASAAIGDQDVTLCHQFSDQIIVRIGSIGFSILHLMPQLIGIDLPAPVFHKENHGGMGICVIRYIQTQPLIRRVIGNHGDLRRVSGINGLVHGDMRFFPIQQDPDITFLRLIKRKTVLHFLSPFPGTIHTC